MLLLQAQREWYQQEEGGGVDETHDPFLGDSALFEKRAQEMQRKMVGSASLYFHESLLVTPDAFSYLLSQVVLSIWPAVMLAATAEPCSSGA